MISAVGDTHTVIWFLARDKRLSSVAKNFIDASAQKRQYIAVSAITFFEIVYLVEKRRIPVESLSLLTLEMTSSNAIFKEIPIDLSIARTMAKISPIHIPDLPDRIVSATALHLGVPLITRDAKIQSSAIQTIW